jgi:hypothetical protein
MVDEVDEVDEVVERLLDSADASRAALLGEGGLLTEITGSCWSGPWKPR